MLKIFRNFRLCASFFKGRLPKLILAAFLLSLGAGYFFFQFSSYYFLIPVHWDEKYRGGMPLVQIEIEEKKFQLELDLGTRMSTLIQEELDKVDKKFYGTLSSTDVYGNSYETLIYKIPQVKVDALSLPMMKIRGESTEFIKNNMLYGNPDETPCSGRAGREIFENKNFLLDFVRSKIILCKDFKCLSKSGYKLKDFIQAPLHVNDLGFCLQIETDAGIKTLLLDTGCSISIVGKKSLENQLAVESFEEVAIWSTDKLMIGSKNFGPQKFNLFEISSLMSEIDGILGMDFLRKHAIFIDKDQLTAYVEK
jgi:hypothetical protein